MMKNNSFKKNLHKNQTVAILLCTYNGDKFLRQQLQSIESQTYQDWMVIASDDGSIDTTLQILKEYQLRWASNKLLIKQGPRDGYSSNFLSLASDLEIKAEYYAFCDQDDVWHKDKLEVAVRNISSNQILNQPYLYSCRSNYLLGDVVLCGLSPLKKNQPSFENALIENIAGGNTMVFNQEVKKILEKIGVVEVVSHDWWVYQIVTGAGGEVFYDPIPRIDYRQHKNSIIGAGYQLIPRFKRIYAVFRGAKRWQYTLNINALMASKKIMTRDHLRTLVLFKRLRSVNFKKRIELIIKSKIYKQSPIENIGLLIALAFKKI
jgi:glycosyltransferase involved in cell wall biosynthesis